MQCSQWKGYHTVVLVQRAKRQFQHDKVEYLLAVILSCAYSSKVEEIR
jgi:hypothetical protein